MERVFFFSSFPFCPRHCCCPQSALLCLRTKSISLIAGCCSSLMQKIMASPEVIERGTRPEDMHYRKCTPASQQHYFCTCILIFQAEGNTSNAFSSFDNYVQYTLIGAVHEWKDGKSLVLSDFCRLIPQPPSTGFTRRFFTLVILMLHLQWGFISKHMFMSKWSSSSVEAGTFLPSCR